MVAPRLKVFVYGPFRTKKTLFSGSFPKPYFFDFDDGMVTLMGKDIEYDTFINSSPLKPTAIRAAQKQLEKLKKDCPYETIVIDSLTAFGDFALDEVLLAKGRPGGVPQQDDWLPQMTIIRNFIYEVLALKKNTVVICHEQATKNEISGGLTVTPLITGKLASKLPTLFDLVFHAENVRQKGNTYEIKFKVQGTEIYASGSRVLVKESYITPTYFEMLKAMGMAI